MTLTLQGIRIPDSKLAREITELVRDTEPALLFHHSSRVYYFGALAGKHRGLVFDPELPPPEGTHPDAGAAAETASLAVATGASREMVALDDRMGGAQLSPDQVSALAAYIWGLSHRSSIPSASSKSSP
jgi:hypothetical protein